MTIEKIMSKDVITITKDQTVIEALKLMKKHKISRLLAVSPKTKELVGIITEKDMATKIASAKYEDVPLTHMRISTIMTPDVITAAPSDSKLQVLKKMVDNHIGAIPVVNEDEIVGIITKSDFMQDLDKEPYNNTPVKDIMTKRVITIGPDDRFLHARRKMMDNNISRIVVVDSGIIMGIVTDKDLVRTIIDFKKRVPEKYQSSQIRNLFVQELMSQTIKTSTKETSISEIANIMLENEFSGIPVADDKNKIQGIITKSDVLRLIYNTDRRRGNN